MRKLMVILAMALVLCGFAMSAQAVIVNLSDANSTFSIDTASANGAQSWRVDGVDQLFAQQWFVGFGAGNENPVSNFPSVITAPPPNNFANITYTSAGNWTLDTTYALSGGAAGTGRSDVAQQATFNNISGATQNLRLYLYTDFDLSGTAGDLGVSIDGNHHPIQFDNLTLMDSVFGPDATRVEANFFPSTFNSLNGPAAYALNNVTSRGPGDDTWALEWIVNVPAGGSFQLSGDNLCQPIPVPPAVWLLGSGLLGLAGLRFRKNRA